MAAAHEPNPYDLRPQPTPHAEPGHVHRFVPFGYTQRCIYCHVHEVLALRKENADLKKRVEELVGAMLEIYRLPPRGAGMRYGGFPSAREIASKQIALSQWRDEQRNDEDR